MLKWFKKLTNRFFGEEVEGAKNESNDEYKQVEAENEEVYDHNQEERQSNFRFPIITDAEIYGWADDDEEVDGIRTVQESSYADDEFETVPLYQNERWPGDKRQKTQYEEQLFNRNINRPAVQRRTKSTITESTQSKRVEKQETLQEDLKDMQNEKRTQRFTPSVVPSPIYGFSKPKNMIPTKESEETLTDQSTRRNSEPTTHEQSAFEPVIEDLKNDDGPLDEKQAENTVEMSSLALEETPEIEEREEPSIQPEVDVELHEEKISEEVEEEEIEQSEVEEETLEVETSEESGIQPEVDVELHEEKISEEVEGQGIGQSEVEEETPEVETSEESGIQLEVDVELHEEKISEEVEGQGIGQSEVEEETLEVETSEESGIQPEVDVELHEEKVSEEVEEEEIAQSEVEEEITLEENEGNPEDEVDEATGHVLENIGEQEIDEQVDLHTEELVSNCDETEELQEEAHITEETPQTMNDEKVVPFNVLMLKSDKRNLHKREMAKQIANEMKEKQQQAQEKNNQQAEVQQLESKEQELTVAPASNEESSEENEELEEAKPYVFPALDYLIPPESEVEDTDWLVAQSAKLEESLSHFGIQADVIDAVQGPTVTRFELTVEQGTKVSRVRNLTDDLKLTLAARDIRIEAPIPGRSSIGIEIPNRTARAVRLSEVIQTEAFQHSESPLEAVLGLGLTGEPATLDLRKMPHGMIAGATGSGKSVCINSILISLLYKASPSDLKMMLIDPKMVELAPFNGIPHLISPVITDVKAATAALKWAVAEMERRYELLAHAGVRDIERYNKQVMEERQFSKKMPYLLIVIDELADLMMMAPADVEVSISRITQKARACGIHLIIATQRPSVDVITGIIKANIPTRIAFSVSSQVDSRTMIDMNGAERLLGKGDMLYIGNGESVPIRLQGTFVTDDEIERIIEHVQREASPKYLFGQNELLQSATEEEEDPLFVEVCKFIFNQNSASTSMLQRKFSIGYNRAAKLMDRLEELAFVSPQQGSKPRDVYLTKDELHQLTEKVL